VRAGCIPPAGGYTDPVIEPPGVQVFGQRELVEHLESGGRQYSHCISIGNPGRGFGRPDTMRPRRIPRTSDIRRVIRFFRRTRRRATGCTLHCWGGVSRSPPVALGIRYLISGSETTSADILRRIRPDAAPHQGIFRHFEELPGADGEE
jgi:protein-tyrosine phosphatase